MKKEEGEQKERKSTFKERKLKVINGLENKALARRLAERILKHKGE